ncbi:MAG: hypothetical protein WAL50_02235 [Kineosporiaceae bacterium]
MATALDTLDPTRKRLTKVPAITATFWVIKILSTTIGETFADYLSVNVGLGPLVTDGIVLAALTFALIRQIRADRYTPWIYWLTVVLVSIFGTQVTDFLTDTLGVSLYVSTTVFTVLLAVVFFIWHRQEMTLSITSINTPRREAFYWGAILTTFALGTAAGDLATEALNLGFRNGVLIFGALYLAALALSGVRVLQVLSFWVAYILTRPLGASLGDLLTQDRQYGGLALGATLTSVLFFTVIVVLVAREQVLAHRSGIAEKGATPLGGRRSDRLWAAAGAIAVVGFGAWFTTNAAADTTTTTAPASAASPGAATSALPTPHLSPSAGSDAGPSAQPTAPAAVHARGPVSKLGNLTSFSTIVADVTAKTAAGDLTAATTRVKDLEVAWDGAEAGLKPRSPNDWHAIDDDIDAVLTALRASQPTQADSLAALHALQSTLNTLQGLRS